MAEKAYAAVLTKERHFDYRDVDIPEIGPDEGLLRMEAAGLCGTDFDQFDGHFAGTVYGTLPMTPGHEILGWIDRLGANAAKRWGVKEGDRVIVETSIPCGDCVPCQDDRPIFCDENMGYGIRLGFDRVPHLWGGYASHLYLHPKSRLHKVPADIPTDAMSLFNPLSNAVRWAAVKPNLKAGQTIVIEGPGQRGLLSVVVARELGAEKIIVTGTDADENRLKLARQFGATATINVEKEDPVERVLEITDGRKVDVVLDVSAGATDPVLQGIEMIRKGGTFIVAGVKTHNALNNFYTDKLLFNEIAMLGVLSSDWSDTAKAVELLKAHWQELKVLCTHAYPIGEAEKAVRVLGREIEDGGDPVHIYLDTTIAP
mgnify:FL=1